MANIFSISQSALMAAQAGLATTGHNIANAATPGYSRQVVIQGAIGGQDEGFGFVGKGTQINAVKRMYSDFLGAQVSSAQTSKSHLDSYYAQIKQINNMLADPDAGLSPALHDFFNGVQNITPDPNDPAARQSMLSSAETLASRFQSLDNQFGEIRDGVNSQIQSSIGMVNVYAKQIAKLNDAIESAQAGGDKTANDLLDQRDQLIADLSKEVKVSVVKQNYTYNVFIGNGQPLVLDNRTYDLVPVASPTDKRSLQVGYVSNGVTTVLDDKSLPGGNLGGYFEFRSQALDSAQNALGRVAIGLAVTFNNQHKMGYTQNGTFGTDFFATQTAPTVTPSSTNSSTAAITATFSADPNVFPKNLTTSDYRLEQLNTGEYQVTRLSDGTVFKPNPTTVDGVDFTVNGLQPGDRFVIRPTAEGAQRFNVAIKDKTQIAAAAPIRTSAAVSNAGAGKITAGSVDASYTASTELAGPITLTYDDVTKQLNASPATTGFPQTYTDGANVTFGGITFSISGALAQGDQFTIAPNKTGLGDSRNALLLGALQSAQTLDNGTTSFQGAYSQMVNEVGNKTRELEVTSAAAGKVYTESVASQQAESGVNLDEEATNLLRYQQAYQAAGKVMQTVNELFDLLVSMGR